MSDNKSCNEKSHNMNDRQDKNMFSSFAQNWWDLDGPMKPLHKMNSCRMEMINKSISSYLNKGKSSSKPISVLDVGCGAGLACEPLARIGHNVHGLDPSQDLIKVAKAHAKISGLQIQYCSGLVEDPPKLLKDKKFDLVLCLEVVEHIEYDQDQLHQFISHLTKFLNPNGLCIISTLNQNLCSFLEGIVMAEYVLKWLPKKTHDWKKFIKPSVLAREAEHAQLKIEELVGMSYNPIFDSWKCVDKPKTNYALVATKTS